MPDDVNSSAEICHNRSAMQKSLFKITKQKLCIFYRMHYTKSDKPRYVIPKSNHTQRSPYGTMLQQIRFFLTSEYYDFLKPGLDEVRAAAMNGLPEGAVLQISLDTISESECTPSSDACSDPKVSDRGHLLAVTDSSVMLHRLLAQGYYAIALYHETNHSEDFSGTPYAVEDLFSMTYDSYEKAYERLAGLPWQILTTPRLTLRESTVLDVEDFYRIYQDPSITKYMENLFPDRNEERSYMRDYIQKIYGFYGFGLWSVIHTVTGTVIGRAGLSVREGYELPELGFVTDVAFQHQGYTYEICEAILRYAWEDLEFPQVQAFCHPENTASLHLLQKLGFTYAGEEFLEGIPHARYIVSLPKSC